MIPLKDDVPSQTFPIVNYGLIALNVAVFLFELSLGPGVERLFREAAVIPALFTGADHHLDALEIIATTLEPALGRRVLYAMFLHGGFLHIIGNMLYLWIFGDNVEDRMGHLRYLVFYLLCGWCATYAQIWAEPASRLPSIGASGAIAGVLGAYLLLYPRARVVTLIPIVIFIEIVRIPAFFVLGFWFLQQFLIGVLTPAQTASTGGVAWWAHIGGFTAGMLLVGLFQQRRRRPRARDTWWAER